jgi:uncharacterized protein (TIGR04255 family)
MQGFVLSDGMPHLVDIEFWHFNNIDGTAGVVLARDAVTFRSTSYTRYEETIPIFERALQHIHDVVDISALTRCGLRYVDVVHPEEGQTFATYLRREIMGLAESEIKVQMLSQASQFTGKSPYGTLVVKFATGESPNYLPLDLAPLALDVKLPMPSGEKIGTLDFDHFADRQEPFTVKSAVALLGELHDAIDQAFKACATVEALQLWGQRNA